MHPSINRGICRILAQKHIRSASLLPTAPAFDDACTRLKKIGITAVGVHLALSAEYPANPLRPVSPRQLVPTLSNSAGTFPAEIAAASGSMAAAEVEQELRAQIELVRSRGFRLTHLDGHMFFYHPEEGGREIFEIVAALADDFNLPWRRPPALGGEREIKMIWDGYDTLEQRSRYYRELLTPELAAESETQEFELILHPADDDNALRTFTNAGMRRYADYCFFTGKNFFDLLKSNHITLLSPE
jgi:predicted glycoside hydrolase/deacetylase ChbG (UPF0249 family)